jgi:hypothetical protein
MHESATETARNLVVPAGLDTREYVQPSAMNKIGSSRRQREMEHEEA